MNDRLKYRIYDTVEGEYIEVDAVRLTPNGVVVWTEKTEPELNPKRYIIEFCTGIVDKYKNNIFENDIIERGDGKKFVIEYCLDKLGFVARTNKTNEVLESLDIYFTPWKIIGNIHKDKELLEEQYEG